MPLKRSSARSIDRLRLLIPGAADLLDKPRELAQVVRGELPVSRWPSAIGELLAERARILADALEVMQQPRADRRERGRRGRLVDATLLDLVAPARSGIRHDLGQPLLRVDQPFLEVEHAQGRELPGAVRQMPVDSLLGERWPITGSPLDALIRPLVTATPGQQAGVPELGDHLAKPTLGAHANLGGVPQELGVFSLLGIDRERDGLVPDLADLVDPDTLGDRTPRVVI